MKKLRSSGGQILLITLLVLALATTVALALISRTTTDVNVSTQVEESSRAFSAAEAGIEESLKLGYAPGGATTLSSGASYSVKNGIIGKAGAFEFPKVVNTGDVATLWLVNHNSDGTLDISGSPYFGSNTLTLCWGWVAASSDVPAIVAAVHYLDGSGNYQVSRVALNPNASVGDGFDSAVTNSGCSPNTKYNKTINFLTDLGIDVTSNKLLMIRIRPQYHPAWIAASTSVDLPQQGNIFNSCGTTGAGVERCITAYQLYRTPLSIFDYALYSSGAGL